MQAIQATATGVLLRVRVQPRSHVEQCEGLQGERIRLRLRAAPVAGAANAACIALLAKVLGVRRTSIQIRAGARSRDKLIHIAGVTPDQVAAALGVDTA